MNTYSTLSNLFFNESSQLTSTQENLYEPSLFSTTTEQIYHDYQYNPTPISILNYSEYLPNNYNLSSYQPSSSLIPLQEQKVSTIKIHINPFFRSHLSNRTNESSFEIKQQQQQHNSSLSSRSRSRSSSIDRQVIKSSSKKRQARRNRAAQRKQFRKEKELIFKRQSSTKSKQRHSSPYRWEHKEEKLERLYKEYSNEDIFKEWKPLLLKDCFELYQYAFEKYYQTLNDN